jgi:hypothetical protein
MQRRSPCRGRDRGGEGAKPGGAPGGVWKDGEKPSRGDSGGGVSQPISDTGEPLFT